ncbi:MAG: cellulase family glycosylhydrolase [Oscillospiraceae bacterium]|nr:cellulase family glycosylhydrolase [Oscillospiraceae bacterium]
MKKLKKILCTVLASGLLLTGCAQNTSSTDSGSDTVSDSSSQSSTDQGTDSNPQDTDTKEDINIYIEGDKFMLQGEEVWLTGMNAPWQAWDDFGGSYDPEYWSDVFSMMHEDGFNSCRIWINCSGNNGVEIDEDGYVSGATAEHWEDLDSLFALAAENEIYVMATLMSFDHFKDSNWKHTRWREMLKDTEKIDSYVENYIIPFCKRYDDNDYVWSIDLINEPDWVFENAECGQISWDNIGDYFARACAAIHENTDDMLVTIGFAIIKYNSPKYEGDFGSDEFLKSRYDNENAYIDFTSVHYYDWQAAWFSCPFVVSAEEFGIDMTKPRVIGECSHTGIKALKQIKPIEDCYEWAYNNGWNGVLAWTDRDLLNGDGVPQYACVKLAGQRMQAILDGTYIPEAESADIA